MIFRKRQKLKADEDVVVITDPQITKKEVKVEEKPIRKAKRKRPNNENSGKRSRKYIVSVL